jgi:peptide deformylase
MILELVSADHPLLKEKMEEFDFKNPPCDPIELANSLIETMHHYQGLGLSANQCGLPYNVFALYSEQPLVCFNPRVVDVGSEVVTLEESCLTHPHLFVKVKRNKLIKVRFQNVYGDMYNEKFTGMTARGFLHEMDHLRGVDYRRQANPIHLEQAVKQQKQIQRAAKRGEIAFKQFNGVSYE